MKKQDRMGQNNCNIKFFRTQYDNAVFLKWKKTLNRCFTKEYILIANEHMKRSSIS